ncbi:MAG: hypothetical protein ACLVL6_14485 [Clostridium paraputrificum]
MIKDSIKREGNNYINLPVIKKFCADNGIGVINCRQEGIDKIEEFAGISDNNRRKVNEWLDKVLKEGIKYVYITKFSFIKEDALYGSELFWRNFCNIHGLDKYIYCNETRSTKELNYRNIKIVADSSNVKKVDIFMSLLSISSDEPYIESTTETYPIFVEIDIENRILEIRMKSKSNIYKIKDGKTIKERIDFANRIQTDKIVKEVYNKLSEDIGFYIMDFQEFKKTLYNCYFKVLSSITETPQPIKELLNLCKQKISQSVNELLSAGNVVGEKYYENAEKDMTMFLEKFISISYPDKSIFKKESFAYPIKLIATDSEDTKLEETTSNFEPLQEKGAFYDHKKIIMDEKSCDGMYLAVWREDNKYYGKEPFVVKCTYNNKGFARIRFDEYVEEEDIKNVLSRIKENI